jgi:hypothetical protein
MAFLLLGTHPARAKDCSVPGFPQPQKSGGTEFCFADYVNKEIFHDPHR